MNHDCGSLRTVCAVISALLFCLAIVGCQGNVNVPAPSSGATISFAGSVQPIFNARCTSCHSAGFSVGSLAGVQMVLTAGQSYGSLVNQVSAQNGAFTLVVPGDAESSLLWLKVSSSDPPVGSTMPVFGSPLSAQDLATLRDWIEQGALDN